MGETGGSSLCWNKLRHLGSASTPTISWSIPTTSRSLLWLLLRCSPHLPTPPDDHQPAAPLLLGRHQGLRHLLLHHRLPLPPLQPPRLPHPVRPLRGSPPLSSACPCPPCSQATSSTLPSPSSPPSAPFSSSCPACTSCMFEASPWEIPLAGVSGSLAPTQLGTKM